MLFRVLIEMKRQFASSDAAKLEVLLYSFGIMSQINAWQVLGNRFMSFYTEQVKSTGSI